jgi:squalene synthase HpnC
MRPHVTAVYAFARVADDIADEGNLTIEERQSKLSAWRARLHEGVSSDGDRPQRGCDDPRSVDDLIVTAVAHSIRALDLPVSLFDDLLSAFGQDTTAPRYASWHDVLEYCRRSANPVGRLVLRIAGYRDDALDQSSDGLCTALQLTNFWQDFGRDWRAGRLYVPRDVQQACGAAEADLSGGPLSPAWGRALAICAAFTRERFEEGRGVCERVRGRLGLELRLTWLGGARALERVEHSKLDLLSYRPTLGAADIPWLLWRVATWRGAAR